MSEQTAEHDFKNVSHMLTQSTSLVLISANLTYLSDHL